MSRQIKKTATRKGPDNYIKFRFFGITIECSSITSKAILFLVIVLIFFILLVILIPNLALLKKNWPPF